MNIQPCRDTSDAVALYLPQRLFLKPFARINITLQLPTTKVSGKSISNWELMERFRTMIQPDTFSVLKVIKSSFEFLRFEGDIDNRSKLDRALKNLDGRSIKLNGFPDSLKLKASEAKLDFPSRHAWDSFFRDAPNMDEMKPGERPDTIYLSNLPIKWFVSEKERMDDDAKPSEYIFRKVFEKFGKIRYVDIPICDPFRKEMKSHITGINNQSYDTDLYFEAYVQFSEYFGFVKAMDALRGTKLMLKQREGEAVCIYIKVDFDRNKHLTDASIKRRSIVRERLLARQHTQEQKEQEDKDKLTKQEEKARHKLEKLEREKLEKMREREERRKAKQLEKLKAKESVDIFSKLAEEEKKLLKTQRKLQSIRLIEELFKRIQLKSSSISGSNYKNKGRDAVPIRPGRDNIVQRYKVAQESELEYQREKLQKALEGKLVLRSALNIGKPKVRASSISSLSSEHSNGDNNSYGRKKIKVEKPTSPERNQMQYAPGPHVPPHMAPYGYPYPPYANPGYSYPPPNAFGGYAPRGMFPPEGRGRGFVPRWRQPRPRMPYFYGQFPGNPNKQYYNYIKQLADAENMESNGGDRSRSRSHSRRRSRSYSRSRSKSRYRSRHSRSRTRSRSRRRHSSYSSRSRSRSRSRRTRSRTRSKSRRSHSHKSRSRSRDRSKYRTRKLKSKSRSRSRTQRERSRSKTSTDRDRFTEGNSEVKNRETKDADKERRSSVDSSKFISPSRMRRSRSKSWSLPKSKNKEKSWSKSPVDKE